MTAQKIDFIKGLDFRPLLALGVGKEDGLKLIAALSPIIDLEFQNRIKQAFTDEEMEAIGKEAESTGIKPEEGMLFLEKKFHQKKGHYFLEEMRLLFNEYLLHAANIIKQARDDTEKFASNQENVDNFNSLMEEKKWDEAAKLLDDTLKSSESSNDNPK